MRRSSLFRAQSQRRIVAVAAALLVAAQAVLGAPAASAASALPSGAYWYTLLNLQKAWQITKGAGVTVAVVDSGVRASLGDLRGQVLPGLDLTGNDPKAQHERRDQGTRSFGHGSDMAALIAGTGNGGGLVGVAPRAKILPIDASAGSRISATGAARGIRWAVDHGADVINLSFGAPGACPADEADAIAYAYRHDVIVLASAADDPGPVEAPANCPGALGIGGVDAAVKPWVNTPSGPELAFVAPAFGLVNEELDNTVYGPSPGNSGTSQATAILSGVFALLRAKYPHDSAREIVTRALYNVHNGLGAGHQGERVNDTLGYGMPLPYYGLTENPPKNAQNPIYDSFERKLTAQPSDSPAPSGSNSAATGLTPPGASDSNDGGGVSGGLIAAIVAGVVVVALLVGFALRRRRPGEPAAR